MAEDQMAEDNIDETVNEETSSETGFWGEDDSNEDITLSFDEMDSIISESAENNSFEQFGLGDDNRTDHDFLCSELGASDRTDGSTRGHHIIAFVHFGDVRANQRHYLYCRLLFDLGYGESRITANFDGHFNPQ